MMVSFSYSIFSWAGTVHSCSSIAQCKARNTMANRAIIQTLKPIAKSWSTSSRRHRFHLNRQRHWATMAPKFLLRHWQESNRYVRVHSCGSVDQSHAARKSEPKRRNSSHSSDTALIWTYSQWLRRIQSSNKCSNSYSRGNSAHFQPTRGADFPK